MRMEHAGISLPTHIDVTPVDNNQDHALIVVSPCYPGYGTTLGNALRRVLLSSLPGAAVTAVKIKGVDHEFSTVPHIKEDVVEIILGIKGLRFRMHTDEVIELELHVKGEQKVTGSMFEKNSVVEIVNPNMVIATITDPAGELNMKILVQNGRGYIPVETREKEKMDVGYMAIDSIYTPIRNVNFKTEHVRVGQMTNYDKLILDIVTDGTMTPADAFRYAARILVEQFAYLADVECMEKEKNENASPVLLEEASPTEEVSIKDTTDDTQE